MEKKPLLLRVCPEQGPGVSSASARSFHDPVNTTATAGCLGHSQHQQRESSQHRLLLEPRGARDGGRRVKKPEVLT